MRLAYFSVRLVFLRFKMLHSVPHIDILVNQNFTLAHLIEGVHGYPIYPSFSGFFTVVGILILRTRRASDGQERFTLVLYNTCKFVILICNRPHSLLGRA